MILEVLVGVLLICEIIHIIKIRKLNDKVKVLEDNDDDIFNNININDRMVNKRIDQEIDRTNNLYKDSIEYINRKIK
jgi:hypothetical protein